MRLTIQDALEWRGIETMCERCGGCGSRAYGSTSTWHGGAGGQMVTSAVCDSCWGSGDAKRPWTDLRKLRASYAAARAASTLDDLLRRIGGGSPEDVRALGEALRKIETAPVRKGSLGFWPRKLAGWLGEELARISGENATREVG